MELSINLNSTLKSIGHFVRVIFKILSLFLWWFNNYFRSLWINFGFFYLVPVVHKKFPRRFYSILLCGGLLLSFFDLSGFIMSIRVSQLLSCYPRGFFTVSHGLYSLFLLIWAMLLIMLIPDSLLIFFDGLFWGNDNFSS